MGPLGAHFRTGYSLSEREREIAVNVILAKWGSAYPTNAHERAGRVRRVSRRNFHHRLLQVGSRTGALI
jgi:hypothetical protein